MASIAAALLARRNKNPYADCTLQTCPLSDAFITYRPNLVGNGFLLALFSGSLIAFIAQGAYSRRFIGFTIAMVSGDILEVLGYIGRIMAYWSPFNEVCE